MQKKELLNFYLWLEALALSATKIEAVSINHSHIKLSIFLESLETVEPSEPKAWFPTN